MPALLHNTCTAPNVSVASFGEALYLIVHRDVATLPHGFDARGAKLGHRRVARCIIEIGQHELHSGTGKRARHTQADAACAAGDHGHFSSQVLHRARSELVVKRLRHKGVTRVPQ
jgi:hypothetical protein